MALTLSGTTERLKAYLDGSYAAPVKVFVEYELETEVSNYIAKKAHRNLTTSVNGTSPVTVLDAPVAGTVYHITAIYFVQPNATETRVKVSKFTGATEDNFIDLSLDERDHITAG